MSAPSHRLKLLRLAMRWAVKPQLEKSATPETAYRSFERLAPLLFSTPRGLEVRQEGPAECLMPEGAVPDRAILYLHGGAFVAGTPRSYRAIAGRLARRTGARVFLPDYPHLQEAPFPAAPDAVLAAWDALLAQGWRPSDIVIAGDSAGGNLVFGLLADLLARGQRPAGVVGFSPWGDLTLSGESLAANAAADPLIPVDRMREAVALYLDGADPRDPRASPVFADFPDPPPVLIQVGADEVLRSDAERLAEKTGAKLEIWPDVPHVWQMFDGRLPEANAAMRQVARFVQTSFDRARR
ncbi:alpha/beta hydrolase [Thalassorhabdomicrobium marinisediminis]|nr:alpha/beta hydrolase [Thalassorhabdomicrobium marinisediminis]